MPLTTRSGWRTPDSAYPKPTSGPNGPSGFDLLTGLLIWTAVLQFRSSGTGDLHYLVVASTPKQ
jgi:hypothetical protein